MKTKSDMCNTRLGGGGSVRHQSEIISDSQHNDCTTASRISFVTLARLPSINYYLSHVKSITF